jgi:hypothetical protein
MFINKLFNALLENFSELVRSYVINVATNYVFVNWLKGGKYVNK